MSEPAYFPYRAQKNRPYIAEFLTLPDKERRWDVLTQMALFGTRRAFGDRESINADSGLSRLVHACCMHESWLSSGLADFFNGGQVVFHITPTLRDAFATSDLGDATVRDLKFPFRDSYIHLGYDTGLVFNGGRTKLEGVLLSEKTHKDGVSVSVTLVGSLIETPAHWGHRGMESFTFHFSQAEMDMPILEGATRYLAAQGVDPATSKDFADLSQFDEEARKSILDSWDAQTEERNLHVDNIPVVLECVRLVANALLYVSQYPDDMADDFQEGFPQAFREKIELAEGKNLQRILSKARNNGFTLIKKVGGVFERAMQVEAAAQGGSGDSPAPHLRRAHWRRQAFGAGLTQRKLIWIRAARVLGGTTRDKPYLVN